MSEKLDLEKLHNTGEFTTVIRKGDNVIIGRYTYTKEIRTVASMEEKITKLEKMHKDIDAEIERISRELKS